MAPETVTLFVAAVAALASLTGVGTNVYYGRRNAREAQLRDLLKPHITQLGETLHQLLACSTIVAKRAATGKSGGEWSNRAHEAAATLKELNRRVKYPLGSLCDGIRELTRLPSWVDHAASDEQRRDALLSAAEELREELDDAIRTAFLRGEVPGGSRVYRVHEATQKLRALWDGRPEEEPEPLTSHLPPLNARGHLD